MFPFPSVHVTTTAARCKVWPFCLRQRTTPARLRSVHWPPCSALPAQQQGHEVQERTCKRCRPLPQATRNPTKNTPVALTASQPKKVRCARPLHGTRAFGFAASTRNRRGRPAPPQISAHSIQRGILVTEWASHKLCEHNSHNVAQVT